MAKVLRQRGRYRGEFSERLSHRDYFWEEARYVGGGGRRHLPGKIHDELYVMLYSGDIWTIHRDVCNCLFSQTIK